MKYFIIALSLLFGLLSFAQKNLNPYGKKRNQVFGTRDMREYKNYGMQYEGGFTHLRTKENDWVRINDGNRPIEYLVKPKGQLGMFVGIGMAHFPVTNPPKINILGKRVISYYDWGLGFKLFGGTESTDVNYYLADGTLFNSTHGNGSFYNGYVFGRITAHNNYYFSKKYYLDNGLGFNFDYRILSGKETYENYYVAQKSHNKFVWQLHYDLGLGIKISRGHYLIPGVQLPLIGLAQWQGFKPSLDWFSSRYNPILFKVKYIVLMELKRSKTSCTNNGTAEDKKRNSEYLQGQ